MRVVLDSNHGDGCDVFSVRLDDGTEVYAASIVEDPKRERDDLEEALRQVIDEDRTKRPHTRARRKEWT